MLILKVLVGLITLVFGMQLLAQTKKDNLGNLYLYVSWAVITIAILGMLGGTASSLCRMHCGMMNQSMEQRENRVEGGGWHHGYGRMGEHRDMMGGCGMMGKGCCNRCCDEMMEHGCCGMKGSCGDDVRGGRCDDDDMRNGGCNMMGGKMNGSMDTTMTMKEKKK